MLPPKSQLEEALNYNPESGLLKWIASGSGRIVGKEAGRLTPSGYRKVRFGGGDYFAHDLIFTLMDQGVPRYVLYKDGDGNNLIWENLESSNFPRSVIKSEPLEKRPLEHTWLLENTQYLPETGEFFWLKRGPRRQMDRPLGSLQKKGYIDIELGNINYKAHRLAWFYMTETWPIEVDHENRVKSDNRWTNLREATRVKNNQNAFRQPGELLPGVRRQGLKFVGQIQVDKVKIYLGTFDTEQEAHNSYREASLEHFGEFSPFFERKMT